MLVREPVPRTKICGSSDPGCPEVWTVEIPVTAPARALAALPAGDFRSSSVPIDVIAPVTDILLCFP